MNNHLLPSTLPPTPPPSNPTSALPKPPARTTTTNHTTSTPTTTSAALYVHSTPTARPCQSTAFPSWLPIPEAADHPNLPLEAARKAPLYLSIWGGVGAVKDGEVRRSEGFGRVKKGGRRQGACERGEIEDGRSQWVDTRERCGEMGKGTGYQYQTRHTAIGPLLPFAPGKGKGNRESLLSMGLRAGIPALNTNKKNKPFMVLPVAKSSVACESVGSSLELGMWAGPGRYKQVRFEKPWGRSTDDDSSEDSAFKDSGGS